MEFARPVRWSLGHNNSHWYLYRYAYTRVSPTPLRSGDNLIARSLDRIYEYFQHLLIMANIRKETGLIDECVRMMTSMRDTWQELFDQLGKEQRPEPPRVNQHGAAVMNLQG